MVDLAVIGDKVKTSEKKKMQPKPYAYVMFEDAPSVF
jgi:hypothetical protein